MVEQFKETRFEDRSYICPRPDDINEMLFDLSKQMISYGVKPDDVIIAVARGGLALSATLSNDFEIKPVGSLEYKSYTGIEFTGVELINDLSETTKNNIEGKRILLIEDIVETGKTVQAAGAYIETFKPREIRVGVLFWNDKKSVVMPDFYAARTGCWVIHPHEQGGFIKEFYRKWSVKGMRDEEIEIVLIGIGLLGEKVDFFISQVKKEIFEKRSK
jgi:hypoxanthine phosphoribosyltransferase